MLSSSSFTMSPATTMPSAAAIRSCVQPLSIIFFFFLSAVNAAVSGATFGINYGQIANNLPDPAAVVPLVKSIGGTKLKLYDADPRVLTAFANTGVEFIIGLGNEYLYKMRDPAKAQEWVKVNVQCHLPATKITSVAVGNEVLTSNDTGLSAALLPAMENIHAALVSLNLDKQIAVTTAHNMGVLEVSSPPSAGSFRRDLDQKLACILDFHNKVGSPFLINAYPYFAYKAKPQQIPLDFVLFEGSGVLDSGTGLHYSNMFVAQVDAVYHAMDKLGYKNVNLQISETGWPSKGDSDEAGATVQNARIYNCNLLRLIEERKGTPLRPNSELNIYVFALFNENQKPGPTSERNFGLFNPNGTPVYDLGFNLTGLGKTPSPVTGGGTGTPYLPSPKVEPPNAYLSINADDAERVVYGALLLVLCLLVPVIVMS